MQIRQAVSARLDGEDPGVDDAQVYAHLAACAGCRAFAHDADELHRAVRLAPAPAMPDLTAPILAAIGDETMARDHSAAFAADDSHQALRWALVVIGLVQIGIALPALLFGTDAGLPVHAARHIGSFDVALGVGFLFAAWKPWRIPGFLPVAVALVVCLFGSSLIDVVAGNTAAFGEVQHVTDFAGLLVAWLLIRPAVRPVRLA